MRIKHLYGVINTETGCLLGNKRYTYKKYAYCTESAARKAFFKQLKDPKNKLVRLVPMYWTENTLEPILVCGG